MNEQPTGRRSAVPAPGASRTSLPAWKKLLFASAPLVVLLCVAEGVCRLFPHRDQGPPTRTGIVVSDPDLLWRLNPDAEGSLATNELGLRDTPFNADADFKVLLLGDSVAWGDKLGADITKGFAGVLEAELNRRLAPRTVEVINSGVPGYSTFQEAAYLKLYGLALDPDVVILQFCLNDVVERYRTLTAFGGDNSFLGVDTRASVRGLSGVLVRHSRAFEALFRTLQARSRRRETYDVERLAQDSLSQELEAAWTRTLGEIEEIRRLTAEQGIPFLLMIAPYEFQQASPGKLRQPQDRLIAYAREHDIPVVDLLPAFAVLSRRGSLFVDANHFSHAGHHVAGEALVEPSIQLLTASRTAP